MERNLCQKAGGWQDQIAASFGGFNRINFSADGCEVLPVIGLTGAVDSRLAQISDVCIRVPQTETYMIQ